ncbi:hypothetical protein LOC68_24310 [Blastopirellula sp. JC732]|uniref:Uncharacterized protein n=1 Tax=Blastopirellula sediminis TaxID=2894196 RepID=A0A9X1MS83_9BACT|nr:hypothetical protein [Blastopirellula sediminis]MCC9605168.1 hypothetical protein [Blastopirellula sediminis]MCC9631532.1 hypothetical protein [Blastopirellula sediminis]
MRSVWEPKPRGKCIKLTTAGSIVADFFKFILFLGGLFLSIFLCVAVLHRPTPIYKDPIWWIVAVVLSCGPFLLFEWLLSQLHKRKRLSIDDDQVCFAGSCVELAELESVSQGQFKVLMEKYFPSLEKAAIIASKPLEAADTMHQAAVGRQKLRDFSLTLTKQNGKQVHWIGALAIFEPADLQAFFATLRERKPFLIVDVGSPKA